MTLPPKPPPSPQDTFWYVLDPEALEGLSGPFATRKVAIKVALMKHPKGTVFWTGRAECSAVRSVLKLEGTTDYLLDTLKDEMEEILSSDDLAGWLEKVTSVQKVELDDILSKAVIDWMIRHKHYPDLFMLEDEERHEVP